MRLLTPVAQRDAKQAENVRQILRAQETQEIVKSINKTRVKAEVDFNDTLAKHRHIWATEEAEHDKRKKEMEAELVPLEERKREALVPIAIYKKQADDKVAEAEGILTLAKEKESKADDLLETLEEKLTAVSDREHAVKTEEDKQVIAREGISIQQEQTRAGVQKLSEQMADFDTYKAKEEESLYNRKKEVTLAEININAKIEKVKRNVKAIQEREIQIEDQRRTLERALANIPPIK